MCIFIPSIKVKFCFVLFFLYFLEPLNVEKCQEHLQSYYDTFSKVKVVPWDDSSAVQIDEIYTPLSWVRDDRKPTGVTQKGT